METLERFVSAQEQIYSRVLAELRAGEKHSHWMWFVFPQIAGLGHSAMARRYGIAGRAEAAAYLAHPLLGHRLAECTDAVLAWAGRLTAQEILGPIDAIKFRSSMTLFEAAGGGPRHGEALDRLYGGERDPLTLAALAV